MTKYLLSRILRSLFSVVLVVAVVMVLVYSLMDRSKLFKNDPVHIKQKLNRKKTYEMEQLERYGYLDYVNYSEFIADLVKNGEVGEENKKQLKLGTEASDDNELAAKYAAEFEKMYKEEGYTIVRLKGRIQRGNKYQEGGDPQLYAYKEVPLMKRLVSYFTSIFYLDDVHKAKDYEGERGLTFTWRDPAYGGEKFSPAIMGKGTHHKYLIYFDNNFPYIHQNLLTVRLGTSFSVNQGVDVWETMTQTQGGHKKTNVLYPSGVVQYSSDDIHSVTYAKGSKDLDPVFKEQFLDDYTNPSLIKTGKSRMGYSFVIGIISVVMAYLLAVPLGIGMALKKDKFLDKLGTFYIVFITAVPSLAYIFMFRAIGGKMGLPTTFDMNKPTALMYILPIVSLALPSVANLMKWLRRYMIDQMNADYVKFARSGGLSEGEIFRKHILKNAIIPIAHGVPASILGAMTGAIITERVYMVPGVGNVLTVAIEKYDNAVIVGVALFYAILTVTSLILGDVLMSMLDPRISFTAKER